MMRLSPIEENRFILYVYELIYAKKPKTADDLEWLSEDIHTCIEVAIQDFIHDGGGFEDYNCQY